MYFPKVHCFIAVLLQQTLYTQRIYNVYWKWMYCTAETNYRCHGDYSH